MKEPAVFSSIRKRFRAREDARRECSRHAAEALHHAKRVIFALHRDDQKTAGERLRESEEAFHKCEALMKKFPDLSHEGSYRAALEEYAEALLYREFLTEGQLTGRIHDRALAPDIFLGGLSDVSGEIVRYAVRRATGGAREEVVKAKEVVDLIVTLLLDLDLTGHLRQKADQAKRNLHTLEQMLYELSLRQ